MPRFKFVAGILAVLIGVGIVSYAQGTQGNTHLGTWIITVTPPAVSGRPAFKVFFTFASGGALIFSTSNDHLVPNAGIQHGSWRRGDHGQINSTEIWFIYAPTGMVVATMKSRATYDFPDANHITGRGELALCDLDGANCTWFPGVASINGKRLEIEEPVGP